MDYFKYLPLIAYSYTSDTGTAYNIAVRDITAHAQIVERLKQTQVLLYDYIVSDEERPDTVSVRLYGTPTFTWSILLVNNIQSLYDWPLSTDELKDYLISKYGSLANARSGTRYYYTIEKDRVDQATYDGLPAARKGDVLTPYEYELQENDRKRRIKVIPAPLIYQVAGAFRSLFR
jgi:hypothetical protein